MKRNYNARGSHATVKWNYGRIPPLCLCCADCSFIYCIISTVIHGRHWHLFSTSLLSYLEEMYRLAIHQTQKRLALILCLIIKVSKFYFYNIYFKFSMKIHSYFCKKKVIFFFLMSILIELWIAFYFFVFLFD